MAGPYLLHDADAGRGFVYPPSAALLLAPIAQSLPVLTIVSLVTLVAGCLSILVRHRRLTPIAAALVIWSVAIHPGVWENTAVGNINTLLAGMLALGYGRGGGALIAVAALGGCIKLHPLAWAAAGPPPGARRAIVIALLVIPPIGLSILLAGLGPWFDFASAFSNARPYCGGTPSLTCLGMPRLVTLVLAIALMLLAFRLRPAAALVVVGMVPVIAAPEFQPALLVYVIPGLVAALAPARASNATGSEALAPAMGDLVAAT